MRRTSPRLRRRQRTLSERQRGQHVGIPRLQPWEEVNDRLELVAEAPDPGNEPHTLRLYQGKLLDDLYEQRARLLVVRNGSPDKGGHRRTFGLPVPDDVSDPVDAAAMLFDVPPETYRELQRRT
jgi:hypothetical protein